MSETNEKKWPDEDPAAVALHIARHTDAEKALSEAAREIRERFGEAELSLCVDEGRLVVTVGTSLSVDEAHMRRMAFLREWWMPNVRPDQRLAIALSFV
jgi:hypothetical protein